MTIHTNLKEKNNLPITYKDGMKEGEFFSNFLTKFLICYIKLKISQYAPNLQPMDKLFILYIKSNDWLNNLKKKK